MVTFLMMGLNLWAAIIIMISVAMVIVHMLGCMALAGINANAVSLVNLVMVSSGSVYIHVVLTTRIVVIGCSTYCDI